MSVLLWWLLLLEDTTLIIYQWGSKVILMGRNDNQTTPCGDQTPSLRPQNTGLFVVWKHPIWGYRVLIPTLSFIQGIAAHDITSGDNASDKCGSVTTNNYGATYGIQPRIDREARKMKVYRTHRWCTVGHRPNSFSSCSSPCFSWSFQFSLDLPTILHDG